MSIPTIVFYGKAYSLGHSVLQTLFLVHVNFCFVWFPFIVFFFEKVTELDSCFIHRYFKIKIKFDLG